MTERSIDAILLATNDNVICLLRDMTAGQRPAVDGANPPPLSQDTALGHKIAISFIERGTAVLKYGAVIGLATKDIEPGEHVHLHNLAGLNQVKASMEC